MCLNKTLLLGDSLTSGFSWATVGTCTVVNAGVGGARIKSTADAAPWLARSIQPRIVHIMIGCNNCPLTESDPEWTSMRDDYNRAIDAFQPWPCKLVLWVPTPFSPAAAPFGYTPEKRLEQRALLYQVQADQGGDAAGVYDEWWSDTLVDPETGYSIAGVNVADGVHLTAWTQQQRYNRMIKWNTAFAAMSWPCQ